MPTLLNSYKIATIELYVEDDGLRIITSGNKFFLPESLARNIGNYINEKFDEYHGTRTEKTEYTKPEDSTYSA